MTAPQKTLINPTEAAKPAGMPSSGPTVQPKQAPIKKLGITSPPLKPADSVMDVNKIFRRKAKGFACPCSTARKMTAAPVPL